MNYAKWLEQFAPRNYGGNTLCDRLHLDLVLLVG
jgi:hypothetical protein